MIGFEYVRNIRDFYSPRTPRAALLAVKSGVLPIEAFVYKSSAVKPLFEEPYDPDELERVLARPDLSFGEAMLLAEIFAAMTRSVDKELALFAAESLTSLENRWARKTEDLRSLVHPGVCEDANILGFGRALYEYALVAGRHTPIRNYYLREAYYVLTDHPEACLLSEGFDLRIRCLLRLGLIDQADAVIAGELGRRDDGELLLLAAEACFIRKDSRRLRELLEGRDLEKLGLGIEQRELLEAWKG